MRIIFESKEEIKRLSSILQDIYPAELCITTDDLLNVRVRQGEEEPQQLPLPWNVDGFHPPIIPIQFANEGTKAGRDG